MPAKPVVGAARLGALLDSLDAIVWEADPVTLRLSFASGRSADLASDSPGAWVQDPTLWQERLHPDDRSTVLALCRAVAADATTRRCEHRLVARDGRVLRFETQVQAVRRPSGGVEALSGLMIDVTARFHEGTERRREDVTRRFLADASTLMTTSLDLRTTLENLAQLTVPELADWCVVDTLDGDLVVGEVAIAHRDPGLLEVAREMQRLYPAHPGSRLGPADALGSRVPQVLDDISDESLSLVARDARHLALLRRLGPRSAILLPLVARGRVSGVITLVAAESGRRFGATDLRFAEEVAQRASVGLDNAQLYQEARHAARSREDLMAIVSHDLRNPLSVIVTAVALLLKGPPQNEREERMRRQIEAIQRSAARMNRLIRDLLDLANVQAGRLALERRRYDVPPLVADALEMLEPLAREKEIGLVRPVVQAELRVDCDRERVLQVFSNVVGNAIKFTPEHGTVTIGVHPEGGQVRFVVSDTGPGISEEEVPHVFDRFWQASKKNREGIGLGLSITKGIVEAHGGRIWVESRAGIGATFSFTLPAVDASPDGSPTAARPG